MILLLSRLTDTTIIKIIEWLLVQNKRFHRINNIMEVLSSLYYDLSEGKYTYTAKTEDMVHSTEVQSYFFHGGGESAKMPRIEQIESKELRDQVAGFLDKQSKALLQQLFAVQPHQKSFGLSPYSATAINKLKVLETAQIMGFTIPPTAVVSKKFDLIHLKNKWERIINKSPGDGVSIITSEVIINGQQTIEVDEAIIDAMSENFFPSLIQKLIEKQYEIRVFYYNKEFYSIAIFTQQNAVSSIDGRQINTERPNREVPFLLPEYMKEKITALMNALELNYGSLDFIYSTDSKFYFLEVNPYGQFGFLSHSGNFYLEKKIAECL